MQFPTELQKFLFERRHFDAEFARKAEDGEIVRRGSVCRLRGCAHSDLLPSKFQRFNAISHNKEKTYLTKRIKPSEPKSLPKTEMAGELGRQPYLELCLGNRAPMPPRL